MERSVISTLCLFTGKPQGGTATECALDVRVRRIRMFDCWNVWLFESQTSNEPGTLLHTFVQVWNKPGVSFARVEHSTERASLSLKTCSKLKCKSIPHNRCVQEKNCYVSLWSEIMSGEGGSSEVSRKWCIWPKFFCFLRFKVTF